MYEAKQKPHSARNENLIYFRVVHCIMLIRREYLAKFTVWSRKKLKKLPYNCGYKYKCTDEQKEKKKKKKKK
jgi:hypothetical protein